MTDFLSPEHIAGLSRLSAEINGTYAPPPIARPIDIGPDGRVFLPVPNYSRPPGVIPSPTDLVEEVVIQCQLHAGMTLQWAPLLDKGGLLIEFRGGPPDGDHERDAVAVFMTARGLRGLIADLQAIEARLSARLEG